LSTASICGATLQGYWRAVDAQKPMSQKCCRTPVRGECLRSHPDRELSEYIIWGLTQGFRVGFCYQNHTCRSARSNMQPTDKNPLVVCDYLKDETESGISLVLFQSLSRRLIVDLSYQKKCSVNDYIGKEYCFLKYPLVDDAVRVILALPASED